VIVIGIGDDVGKLIEQIEGFGVGESPFCGGDDVDGIWWVWTKLEFAWGEGSEVNEEIVESC